MHLLRIKLREVMLHYAAVVVTPLPLSSVMMYIIYGCAGAGLLFIILIAVVIVLCVISCRKRKQHLFTLYFNYFSYDFWWYIHALTFKFHFFSKLLVNFLCDSHSFIHKFKNKSKYILK